MQRNEGTLLVKELIQMPKNLSHRFTNEEAARAHLEGIRWPDGPVCPHCGCLDKASRIEGGRKGLIFCNACRKQYTVTVGSVFERSKIPLHTWLYANHLLCSSKKGMSAHQLHRTLGVTYKTAWFMAHRIREAMAPAENAPPMGGIGKTVEADEMFIGHKTGKRKTPGSGGYGHKRAILSLVERKGAVRSFAIDEPTRYEIRPIMEENIRAKTKVYTDGANYYRFMPKSQHETVNHSAGEYVRYTKGAKIHTNTVEGAFSIFRRGMVGTYQHCGEQHLNRYLAEFDFRYSNRASLGINDDARADIALKAAEGKRLTYRRTRKPEASSPAD
jgi:transposase-like protein